MLRIAVSIVLSLILAGCSGPQKSPKELVRKGMDKAEVLEILGNPSRTGRVRGSDRWSYDTYQNDTREVTYVFFKAGKVTSVGDSPGGPIPESDSKLGKELKQLNKDKKKQRMKNEGFRDL